jgi:hypothetical protein
MKTVLMAAAASTLALTAAAEATAQSRGIGPSQPIPYGQYDAYQKATPSQRASRDWWSGQTTPSTTRGFSTTPGAIGASVTGDHRQPNSASADTSAPASGDATGAPGSPAGPSGEVNTGPQPGRAPNPR